MKRKDKEKKNDKEKKKADMPEFHFKQFTPEEDRIYEEAVTRYREAISSGKKLRQVYESFTIADKELEKLIQADFLKILIAERHFAKGVTLEALATELDIPQELVKETYGRMLQEVGVTAANQFGQEFTGFDKKTDD
jgi:hypothetical protein